MADLIGLTLGQYQIVERLGRGGMADVYKVFHPGLAVYRALKVIRPEFVTEEGFKERFQREAQAVAALRHPNIVQMHDFGVQDNLYYMVMEFIEGRDLKTYLTERGQVRPFSEVVPIIEQVALALSYAHRRGVVHRDIKPGNIMLTTEGQVILTDFGIAKMVAMEERMTQTGLGIGTPAYMAPEQARGLPNVGPPADVYSLGIVLYEMLTGQVPYSADTPLAVMLKVVNDPMPPPRDFSPDIPDVLQGVILKATAKEPEQRYPTPEALVDGLKQSLKVQPDTTSAATVLAPAEPATRIAAPTKPERDQRRSPWLVTGVVLIVLLCLLLGGGGAGLYLWLRPEPSPTAVAEASVTPSTPTPAPSEAAPTPIQAEASPTSIQADTPAVTAGEKSELQFGESVSGALATAAETDTYTFEGAEEDQVVVRLAAVTPADLTPAVKVYGPDGTELCSDWTYEPILTLECQLEADGVQTILVSGSNGGEYGLSVQRTNEPADATPMGLGETISGVLASAAEMATYTVEGQTEDVVVLRLAESGEAELTPEVRVYGPDGWELCSDWTYEPILTLECQLEADGVQTILVSGSNGGEYGLSVQRTNEPADATPMGLGETVSGVLATAAEMATYTVEGQAEDVVVLRLAESGEAALTPEIRVYGPDGTEYCSDWTYEPILSFECQLEADGVQTILVSGSNSGEYDFSLTRLN